MSVYEGEFTTVWDDGVEVVNVCSVDLDQMKIIEMDEERWLAGECDGYDIDTIDDVIEHLIEEYVYIEETDTTYTAAPECEHAEDRYGSGIVYYEGF